MFEESDDEDRPRNAAQELEALAKTVTSDAAELSQLLRAACTQLGGPLHIKADQTLGLLISSHSLKLLPTLWTVLLQKLRDCDKSVSKVAVVSHFSNICDRINVRQRSDAFRGFAKEAIALFGTVEIVADRRFSAAVLAVLQALGVHAAAEGCIMLQDKLLEGFSTWSRQDARRSAATLAVAFSRWTRHCGRVADLLQRMSDAAQLDRGSFTMLVDTAMPAVVAQAELISTRPGALATDRTLVAKLEAMLAEELTTASSATSAASLASALTKSAAHRAPSDVIIQRATEALRGGVKPMLLCPLLQLVRTATPEDAESATATADLARRFTVHSDMLVRQAAFELLATAFEASSDATLIEACRELNTAFQKHATGADRCPTTLLGVVDAMKRVLPSVPSEAFSETVYDILVHLDRAEALSTQLPAVRDSVLECLERCIAAHGPHLLPQHVNRICDFITDASNFSLRPSTAVLAASCLYEFPEAYHHLTSVDNALAFALQGASTASIRNHHCAPDTHAAITTCLLQRADGLLLEGQPTTVTAGAALLNYLVSRIADDPRLQDCTLQCLGVVETVLSTLNSPATSSLETTCELLRALQYILPLGPEEDALGNAFRLCGTLLRRCCYHVEPATAAAAAPRRVSIKVAGTLLEDVRMVEELTDSVDNAAQAHLSTSDTSGSLFKELLQEVLASLSCIARCAHGYFRDALQLQCAPVLSLFETTAAIAPEETIDAATSFFVSLYANPDSVPSTDKLGAMQRRVRVVQLIMPALNRALVYDLPVIGRALLEFLETLALGDAATQRKDESCYLAFDPELGLLKRLVEIGGDPKTFALVRGPALITSLLFALDTLQANLSHFIADAAALFGDYRAKAAELAGTVWKETGADAFIAVLGISTDDASPVDMAAPQLTRVAGRAGPTRDALAVLFPSDESDGEDDPRAFVAASLGLHAARDPWVSNLSLPPSGDTASEVAWRQWAFGPVDWPRPGDHYDVGSSGVTHEDLLKIWDSSVEMSIENLPASPVVTVITASQTASSPRGGVASPVNSKAVGASFYAAAALMPYPGALLSALPLSALEVADDAAVAPSLPMLVLDALRYANSPDELTFWLAAAAALGSTDAALRPWRRQVLLTATSRTYQLGLKARTENAEQTAAIMELLANVADENGGDTTTLSAAAVLLEWMKPGGGSQWCWEDAIRDMAPDVQRSANRLFRSLVGLAADVTDQQVSTHIALELLGRSRAFDRFRESTLLTVARCISGTLSRTLVSNTDIPIANPRVFDLLTEFIFTVGLNETAAQNLHAEITPLLVDPSVTRDTDYRDAVLRCSAALCVAIAEERRSRPAAHTGTSDFQALFADYPLKQMAAEGTEALFDAVHDATFAPWQRADVLVRHWNQFRRGALLLNPAENTVETSTRDRLCTSILNFMIPNLATHVAPTADVHDVWLGLNTTRLLAFKCGSQLRRTHIMRGAASSQVLELCTAFCRRELNAEILRGTAALADTEPLATWCGLPCPRKSTAFHDTYSASTLLVVFSSGLRSNSDSDAVKTATHSTIVIRAALRTDWLNLGSGLCALTGFAYGPKTDQAYAASYFGERAPQLIVACSGAPLVLAGVVLLGLRTAFAFMAAMPDDMFVSDMSRCVLRHVANSARLRSVRLRSYAFFMLQCVIGMQAVETASTGQWVALRKSLQEASEISLSNATQVQSPLPSHLSDVTPSEDELSDANGPQLTKGFSGVPSASALFVIATRAAFVLRALSTQAAGDERDRTTSTVIDFYSTLKQRDIFSAPHTIVVLRMLRLAMPANERMFMALNQFSFTPLGLVGTIDALDAATPADTAEMLSHLNLLVSCVSQHASTAGEVWWIATVMLWMASSAVNRHLHRALGRTLVRSLPPSARAAIGRAASLWLLMERPNLHRSVLQVFDSSRGTAASGKETWRLVAAGLRK
jgi:hypothetical protein